MTEKTKKTIIFVVGLVVGIFLAMFGGKMTPDQVEAVEAVEEAAVEVVEALPEKEKAVEEEEPAEEEAAVEAVEEETASEEPAEEVAE